MRKWIAVPIDSDQRQSPWLFGDEQAIEIVRRILDRSYYAPFAREGANTRGANGVYFVEAFERRGRLWIRNLPNEGDDRSLAEREQSIEPTFVYPLLRGRDVRKWVAEPTGYLVMPHDHVRPATPVPFGDLPPKTREFLSSFRDKLSGRRRFRNFDPTGAEWHGLYSVLDATFAPFKVVWREMATGTVAAIVPLSQLSTGEQVVVVPDHKLFLIPCESLQEAEFVCGFFNSSISSYIVRSYALSTGISTHVLDRLPIPQFNSRNRGHLGVVEAAQNCYESARAQTDDQDAVTKLDRAVGHAAGLSPEDVRTLSAALRALP